MIKCHRPELPEEHLYEIKDVQIQLTTFYHESCWIHVWVPREVSKSPSLEFFKAEQVLRNLT